MASRNTIHSVLYRFPYCWEFCSFYSWLQQPSLNMKNLSGCFSYREIKHLILPISICPSSCPTPWILQRVSGQPQSAQESTKMRRLHQMGRDTKKFLFLCSSCLCLIGWGSSSLEILKVCSCADLGSLQLGTPVA